jgi:hypothetical protein
MKKNIARKEIIEEMTEEEILENFDFEAELKRESEDNDSEENDFKPDDEVGHEEEEEEDDDDLREGGEESPFPGTRNEFGTDQSADDLVEIFESEIQKSKNFLSEKIPAPRSFLYPILSQGDIAMLHAMRGYGKTWIALIIAVMLTTKRKMQALPQIGLWELRNKAGVLFIDGEAGPYQLQKRLKFLTKYLGEPSKKKHPLYAVTANRLARKCGSRPNLADPKWREAVFKIMANHDEIDVLIIDNLAALISGADENSKMGWDGVKNWLLDIRDLNKASLFLHHSGRNGQPRGTGSREDSADTLIKLSRPSGYKREDLAHFKVELLKGRNVDSGKYFLPFNLKIDNEKGKSETSGPISDATNPKFIKTVGLLISTSFSQTKISEKVGVSENTVRNYKKKAVKDGLLDEKRNPTMKGLRFLKKHKLRIPKPLSAGSTVEKHKKKSRKKNPKKISGNT